MESHFPNLEGADLLNFQTRRAERREFEIGGKNSRERRSSLIQRAVVSGRLATVLRASERSPHPSQFSSHDGTKSWYFLVFRAVRGARETHHRRFANVNHWRGDTASTGTGQPSPRRIRSGFSECDSGRCQVRFRG